MVKTEFEMSAFVLGNSILKGATNYGAHQEITTDLSQFSGC